MPEITPLPPDYAAWLAELKTHIHSAQQRATLAVNRELVLLYWQIGRDILERQGREGWGARVIERLAQDLRSAFPGMKGFSRANLMYMRAFAESWPEEAIVQQAVGQLPWGHNLVLLTRLKQPQQRLAYAERAIEHGWSRSVLVMQIETRLLERQGQAVTNFPLALPKPQSDLAHESLKDPYIFDFLTLTNDFHERELETGLMAHLEKFLLELGQGFAFVGRQYHVEVSGQDFYLDLLFYHLKLRCFVVVDLKRGDFKPEYAGKMNFYCNVVDDRLRHESDAPTIGLILCQQPNRILAEYALRGIDKPIGVSAYELTRALPVELQTSLPSIEQIEQALADGAGDEQL
jgi:predicted nuclease of restriction endonuclease-like (RecB) superfamily